MSYRLDANGPLRVAVIVGSTREGRAGPAIAEWFADQARQREDLDIDVIDLADFDLPAIYPQEPSPPITAFTARIGLADAFVVVTPEYNHSYPASLKQAIDFPHAEWQAKPVAFVSYGGLAQGLRAVEQLRLVFAELHAVTVRDTVSFNLFDGSVGDDRRPRDPDRPAQAAKVLLDRLTWWARALRDARTARPYTS